MAAARQADLDSRGAGRAAALRELLAYLRDDSSVVSGVYLQGSAGVGMSTVLSSVAARARRRGHRLVVISGSHAERDVAYAGLHQMLHACRRLPAARPAIDLVTAALGSGTAAASLDPAAGVDSALARAVGALLAAITVDAPALVVVDNAHRLDARTSATMAYALAGAPVPGLAVVLGGHPAGARAWPSLRARTLPGLPQAAARRLLLARAPGLDRWLADRIVYEAAGRPLALVELPIAWRDRYTPGADLVEQHSPLTTRLAQSLLEEATVPPLDGALDLPDVSEAGSRRTDPLLAAALAQTADPTDPPVTYPDSGDPIRRAVAVQRSGQRDEQAGRALVEGASAAADLGRFEVVAALLDDVPERINPIDAVRRDLLLRRVGDGTWPRLPSAEMLCTIADTCRGAGNPDLALDLLAAFAETVTWTDVDEPARRRLLVSLGDLDTHRDDPRRLLVAATLAGHPGGVGTGRQAGLALRRLGRLEPAIAHLEPVVAALNRQRRFGLLVPAAAALADAQLFLGRWDDADRHLRAATDAAERTGQVVWLAYLQATAALLLSWRGDLDTARGVADAAEMAVGDRPLWPVRLRIAAARGTALMTEERFAEACVAMEPVLVGPSVRAYAIDLAVVATLHAEAASRGRPRPERQLPDNLSPDGEAHRLYARALLQPDEAAFTDLLERTGRLPWLRARVQLTYGSWLRRERRIGEAREQLHAAGTAFAALSARHWSDRTEQELRATGADQRGGLLTPQELAVVKLAATGLSNREIGARLHLSARTVESHLARAFPKLSISSRHQLPARLYELT
ncbi:LuxR C-terminal-related transcriptional regulator [Micromonospora sp. NPDC049523]|uniref:LuxR C-terminal-related transcriptional regulator n=1 Tax=Micromonospora sp. NPDC049523 TaxID=3155921 RepID=UPI0034418668